MEDLSVPKEEPGGFSLLQTQLLCLRNGLLDTQPERAPTRSPVVAGLAFEVRLQKQQRAQCSTLEGGACLLQHRRSCCGHHPPRLQLRMRQTRRRRRRPRATRRAMRRRSRRSRCGAEMLRNFLTKGFSNRGSRPKTNAGRDAQDAQACALWTARDERLCECGGRAALLTRCWPLPAIRSRRSSDWLCTFQFTRAANTPY